MSEKIMMEEWEEEQDQEGFRVTDDQGAKWCVDRINEACREFDEINEWYQAMIKKAMAKRDATIDRMRNYLRYYADLVPMKETKTQRSYPITGGKLILKKQQPKFEVDDDTLVPWLKSNFMAHLVKVKESADWATLKKVVNVSGSGVTTDEGEVIPGVTVTQRPDVFKVEMEDSHEL
jgi:hypothetical protein